MARVNEILKYFNEIAPFYMKLDFDNIGLLVGFHEAEIHKVIVALDITDNVIDEAIKQGAQLIVSHHPLLFDAIKRVTDDDSKGRKIITMIRNGISAVCLHTNLDTAEGGVNDLLMQALGGTVTGLLAPHGNHPNGKPYGVSRLGELSNDMPFSDFLAKTKSSLNSNGLRYVDGGKNVKRIVCCGGAGAGDMLAAVAAGCDTYVTADLKYDHFLMAKELGLNLIDADHYCTENVVVPYLRDALCSRFPELSVTVAACHQQTIQFI